MAAKYKWKALHSIAGKMWYHGFYGPKWGAMFYAVRNSMTEFLDVAFPQHFNYYTLYAFYKFLRNPVYEKSIRQSYKKKT